MAIKIIGFTDEKDFISLSPDEVEDILGYFLKPGGGPDDYISGDGTVTSFPTSWHWNNVTGKPATATRWPTWGEVTDKPPIAEPMVNSVSNIIDGNQVHRAALVGDVTAGLNSNTTSIANNVVTNTKLAQVPTGTLKGRTAGGTGNPTDLTAAQVRSLLNVQDGATAGANWGEIDGSINDQTDLSFALSNKVNVGDSFADAYAQSATTAPSGYNVNNQVEGQRTLANTVQHSGLPTAISGSQIYLVECHLVNDTGLTKNLYQIARNMAQSGDGYGTVFVRTGAISTGGVSWNDWAQLGGSGGGAGTVTSVGLTAPTGFTVSNSPITDAGDIALTYASGYQGYTTTEANKLAGIAVGAQVNVPTNLSIGTRTSTAVPIVSSTGSNASFPAATTSLAGAMAAADKVKLNGISASATAGADWATNLTGIPANITAWASITPSSKFNTPSGTTSQYIRGDGSLATFPSIPSGTVTSVSGGNGLTGTVTSSGSIALGTPGTITLSSTNSVATSSHTHNFAPGGTTSQYIRGNGSLATFPSIPTSSNYVATSGNQTNLSGNKTWTGTHRFSTSSGISDIYITSAGVDVGGVFADSTRTVTWTNSGYVSLRPGGRGSTTGEFKVETNQTTVNTALRVNGSLTATGNVNANAHYGASFRSNAGSADLSAASSGGGVRLMPNGYTTTGQTHITGNGNMSVAGEITASGHSVFLNGGTAELRSSGAHLVMSVGGNGGVIYLRPNGDTASSGQFRVLTNGNAVASGTVTGTNLSATSDPRLKDDIKKVKARRELIEKLEYFSFKWKKDGGAGRSIMADKVQEIAPEHVHVGEEDGMLSVDKGGLALEMVFALIDMLKENEDGTAN